MDVRVGLWRKLSVKELMFLNYGVGEDSWETLRLQGDPTSPILKEISLEYSLEGLMLKLKFQYFGHLMRRTDSLEKTLMRGKTEGRRRGRQRMRWLDGITNEELTHLKRPWCRERLKAGGEGDDREWDGWMASLTQWTWVWVNSGSWWWTGRPGVLQSLGL